jgi:hypothetical protein
MYTYVSDFSPSRKALHVDAEPYLPGMVFPQAIPQVHPSLLRPINSNFAPRTSGRGRSPATPPSFHSTPIPLSARAVYPEIEEVRQCLDFNNEAAALMPAVNIVRTNPASPIGVDPHFFNEWEKNCQRARENFSPLLASPQVPISYEPPPVLLQHSSSVQRVLSYLRRQGSGCGCC